MSVQKPTRMPTGVRQRHGRACRAKSRCNCPWVAEVYSKRDSKKIRKQWPTKAAALAWRNDATTAVRKRVLRAPTATTLDEATKAWLADGRAGIAMTRSGAPYKPGTIRSMETGLRLRVLPEFGNRKLSDISAIDLRDFVDGLLADGLSPSAIGVTILPLRAIYRRAQARGEVEVNPTRGLAMPRVQGGRDRVADPAECEGLLAALSADDRPVWATAMFGGLRRGELMALRIEDVDLGAGVIHVRRSWDVKAGAVATKNGKDRIVPIAVVLRDYLDEHLLGLDWRENPHGLVFGASAVSPFTITSLARRAKVAWKAENERRVKAADDGEKVELLDPITLHECRHTFASLMIAAGVNAKALSTYMGHANMAITMDRYGHLMPGNEAEAAGLLDAYFERANTAARLAQIEAS